MSVVEVFGHIAFVGAVIGGFVSWFIAFINLLRTVANRKPGVPLFPSWWESPFNIVFYPSQLTDRGLSARRWFILGIVGFFVCWVFGIVIGVSTGVAH